VFWSPLRVLSEKFLVLRRTERDMIKNVNWSSCDYDLWSRSRGNTYQRNKQNFIHRNGCAKGISKKIKDGKIRNEHIKEIMGMKEKPDIIDIIERRLQWYGHVKRMQEERLPKLILEWIPGERRKRGRPRQTWMEDVRAAMKTIHLDI
jgi:hypothetical protein